MVRFIAPPPANAQGCGAGRGRRGEAGRAGRGPDRGLPPDSPYTRPDYSYQPNEWNPLEVILDANILRVWVNDGPEGGTTNGQADEDIASYGPVALYVGGTGEVRFKQVELKDLGRRVLPDEQVSSRFRMQRINDFYYGWSATAADINHDGILDIVSGPFYYLGPDYRVSREIYFSKTSDVSSQLTPAMVNFAYDYTGDGWPDVLIASGRPMSLYVNPKGERAAGISTTSCRRSNSEIAVFKDIDGDGKPDVVFVGGGAVCWASPDPANPTAPWIVHQVSQQGYGVAAQHGIGAGDINGDGRMDIVSPYGWWEQPPKGTPEGPGPIIPSALGRWPRAGGSVGGAEMGVYDVNGDGLNDIVTSLGAHGWGLAWFEQKRDKSGAISFIEHMIMDDYSTKNAGRRHVFRTARLDGRRYRRRRNSRFRRGQAGLLAPGKLHRPGSVRPGRAVLVPDRAQSQSARRRGIHARIDSQPLRRGIDRAGRGFEQGWRDGHRDFHEPGNVYLLGQIQREKAKREEP